MADIKPFYGIRPQQDLAAEVAAPPYDVLGRQEAADLISAHPLTFMRVIRADAELRHIDRFDPSVFAAAKQNFQTLIDKGALVQDTTPSLYLYELTMGGHVQTGLVGAASLNEYEQGRIKRHEKTRKPELEGRTAHIEATEAFTGPAFLTYRTQANINDLVELCKLRTPDVDFTADDTVRHRLWVVSMPNDIEKLQRAFADIPALYIADGHHRTAASSRVRTNMRTRLGLSSDTPHGCDHYLAVCFPHDQLRVLAYNRVIKDIGNHTPATLLEAISRSFDITPTDSPNPDRPRSFGMFLDGCWYRLTARPETYNADDPLDSLDVSILQQNLIAPLLGIEHPRTDPRIKFVGGVRGHRELENRAAEYDGIAFALYPVAIEQVMNVADMNEVMPPKSTWFEPKLRSGLVTRMVNDQLLFNSVNIGETSKPLQQRPTNPA